ncbi:MAG: BlaI/MecI/CopY family transcriptional regulator [Muribaculaceae bacterium]|nr:BlaI/MecI/CopY family transcriptional regulator [Muribaculaceae bacterium]MDE6612328.1 BlaI/MecI/CopY family transcriptional regulator [Muribaculaceae bacterium]
MSKTKKLTEKEAEVMERLWAEGPLTVRELLERYADPRPHFNTVSTIVRILVDKGFVEHVGQRGGAYLYGAVARPEDFARRSLAQIVKSYFNNSYSSVVSALVEEEKISVEELREIIDMVERQKP